MPEVSGAKHGGDVLFVARLGSHSADSDRGLSGVLGNLPVDSNHLLKMPKSRQAVKQTILQLAHQFRDFGGISARALKGHGLFQCWGAFRCDGQFSLKAQTVIDKGRRRRSTEFLIKIVISIFVSGCELFRTILVAWPAFIGPVGSQTNGR